MSAAFHHHSKTKHHIGPAGIRNVDELRRRLLDDPSIAVACPVRALVFRAGSKLPTHAARAVE
eukprot:10420937-Alexandrium_andersonii.AAC.1